jgi:hypothetical protein
MPGSHPGVVAGSGKVRAIDSCAAGGGDLQRLVLQARSPSEAELRRPAGYAPPAGRPSSSPYAFHGGQER